MNTNAKKNLILLGLLFACGLSFSQVGINTTTPRKTLEVAGDMKVSQGVEIGRKRAMTSNDQATFLTQDTNNDILALDVSNPTNDALGYIQEYIITNANQDWVLDFNTQIDATKFDVISISAFYDRELVLSSAPSNFSLPYTAAFVKNGTWRIIADFPSANNRNPNYVGTWTITTLIFSKNLSKQFGVIEVQMGNTTTGAASTPFIN